MSYIIEVLFRFGLPGFPLFIVGLITLHRNFSDLPDALADMPFLVSILIVLFLGYIVQQTWFLVFERSPHAYDSSDRPVLRELTRITLLPESETLIPSEAPSTDEVYAFWESIMYSKETDPEMLTKASRIWDFVHTNGANALGLTVASIVSFGILLFKYGHLFLGESGIKTLAQLNVFSKTLIKEDATLLYLIWLPLIFLLIASFLFKKAKISLDLIESLEKNWLLLWYRQKKSRFQGLKKWHQVGL